MSNLTPPDMKQCQALKPNGNSFMTLGGKPGHDRCTNKPVFIATENKPGNDGKIGSMSLCDSCATVLIEQAGADYCTFTEIKP